LFQFLMIIGGARYITGSPAAGSAPVCHITQL
jgi:hypothetical protein